MSSPTLEPQGTGETTGGVTEKRPLLFRLLGIKRREGKRIPIGLTKWGMLLVLGVVGVVGAGSFAEYSMQPDFCHSCHIMEPYYQAWHNSTHKNVACVKCHFAPGLKNTLVGKWQASSQAIKYITQTYGSKPHAEIQDASCMREDDSCHSKRLLEGKVNWPVPTKRGTTVTIRFDHTPHLTMERRGKQLRCVSCHSQIVQGQHLVVTLDTCFLCHFKGLEHGRNDQTLGGCRNCHDAPKNEIRLATGVFKHSDYLNRGVTCENCHSDAVKGDGAVPRQVCWSCHNQPAQIARFGETNFLHDQHITKHKVECSSCHIQIEHSLTAGAGWEPLKAKASMANMGGSNCSLCHEQTHGGPAELYQGTGGRGVPDMPSPMYRAQVDCIACHKEREKPDNAAQVTGQTYVAAQASCNYCHGTKYDGVLDGWRKTIAEKLEKAEEAQAGAKAALDRARLSAADQLKANRLLDDADHNIRLVKLGHGVHNPNYATALLSAAADWCQQANKLAEKPVERAGT